MFQALFLWETLTVSACQDFISFQHFGLKKVNAFCQRSRAAVPSEGGLPTDREVHRTHCLWSSKKLWKPRGAQKDDSEWLSYLWWWWEVHSLEEGADQGCEGMRNGCCEGWGEKAFVLDEFRKWSLVDSMEFKWVTLFVECHLSKEFPAPFTCDVNRFPTEVALRYCNFNPATALKRVAELQMQAQDDFRAKKWRCVSNPGRAFETLLLAKTKNEWCWWGWAAYGHNAMSEVFEIQLWWIFILLVVGKSTLSELVCFSRVNLKRLGTSMKNLDVWPGGVSPKSYVIRTYDIWLDHRQQQQRWGRPMPFWRSGSWPPGTSPSAIRASSMQTRHPIPLCKWLGMQEKENSITMANQTWFF